MKQVMTYIASAMVLLGSFGFAMETEKKKKPRLVAIETPYGKIKVRLYEETPLHSANFMKLVEQKFYDSLLFHRVIDGFMIQGGDPDSKKAPAGKMLGNGDVGYTIPAEFNPALHHKRGVIAAAREGDHINPKKASSGCQFYIVQGKVYTEGELRHLETRMNVKFSEQAKKDYMTIGGTPFLDMNYTVFGEVVEGLNLVDSIARVPKDVNDRPLQDISMKIRKLKR